MLHEQIIKIIEKLKEATQQGVVVWTKENESCYSASVEGQVLYIEFLYMEATNRAGADKHSIHLFMPGLSGFFASGTRAYCMILEVLAIAFSDWQTHVEYFGDQAIGFLEKAIERSGPSR